MAIIDHNPNTKFEKFSDGLVEFPFIRVAIFSLIASIVFYLFKIEIISNTLLYVVAMAIVARLLSFLICAAIHPVTRTFALSLSIGVELSIAARALQPLAFHNVVSWIAVAALFIAAICLLIRIFIALFIRWF